MDALKRARRPIRKELNKSIEVLERLLKAEAVDLEEVRVQFRITLAEYTSLSELDQKVMQQMVDDNVTEEVEDEEYTKIREIKVKVETLRVKVDDLLAVPAQIPPPIDPSDTSTTAAGEVEGIGYRLPKVQFTKFGGNLMDWLGFWAQFKKVDQHPKLDGSEKFGYLLMYLEEGSEAHEIVKVFPHDNENYPMAVAALKRRFGDQDLLLQVYIRELLKLVISNSSSKEKLPLPALYSKVDSFLRALKTLNLESADPATWLYPLVESCLPDDTMLTWQRSPMATEDGSLLNPKKTRLDLLIEFLGKEVDIRQRMGIARGGFQNSVEPKPVKRGHHEAVEADQRYNYGKKFKKQERIPTLNGFQNVEAAQNNCVFCKKKGHLGVNCMTARRKTFEERKNIIAENKLCFNCLGHHIAKNCRSQARCLVCGGRHCTIMCRQLQPTSHLFQKIENTAAHQQSNYDHRNSTGSYSNQVDTSRIALQTLSVNICNGQQKRNVRVFLDSGSQRSYILKSTAKSLKLPQKGAEVVRHELFGGRKTEDIVHHKYDIQLQTLDGAYGCILEVRDQLKISSEIRRPTIEAPHLCSELRQKGIILSDVGAGCPPIDILLGADVYGHLLTGKVEPLSSGPVAVETKFGWTLVGQNGGASNFEEQFSANNVVSMAVNDCSVTQLWDLDTIGVRDDTDVKTSLQEDTEAKEHFLQNIKRDESGRYVIKLPWKDGHPPLPSNREVAMKRLERTTKKLNEIGMLDVYNKLICSWENEDFIEEVTPEMNEGCIHYIPHRAVIKPGSLTTPVRPVFDASCKVGKFPSLNECLHKGTNYIQLIPEILLRWREKKIGFVSDIRKAFQMIVVDKSDRNAMRFLWWDKQQQIKEFRHKRVMFGATCSPFILGAVLDYHLTRGEGDQQIEGKLLASMYVDNCVSSEETIEDYHHFREVSTKLLLECGMDLRMWLSNVDEFEDPSTHTISVLGLQWDRNEDVAFVKIDEIVVPEKITKRTVLSSIQKLFDPLGIICSALIPVKGILQRAWISKMKWDEPLPDEEAAIFRQWVDEIHNLGKIRIRRQIVLDGSERGSWSMHIFCDASKIAYSTVIYIRSEKDGVVSVRQLISKARVMPVKKMSMPRAETLGCLIGARCGATVKNALGLHDIPTTYYTDSSTALAWIKRDNQWRTFVGNRTTEINRLTDKKQWVHVPGNLNPADLPSRGCSPAQLLASRLWEGPSWLYDENFDQQHVDEVDEEEVAKEMKDPVVKSAVVLMSVFDLKKKQRSFASYVRVVGWMRRFVYNCQQQIKGRGKLTKDEVIAAEQSLILWIQQESFSDRKKDSFHGLEVYKGDSGLLYVKTRVVRRADLVDSATPLLLPGKHPLVRQLIEDTHRAYCHAGVGFLLTALRRKYWILQSRKSIRSVVSKCVRCRRFSSKPVVTETAPLPLDRIKDAEVFEVVGVDLAGPLILKTGKKTWMVIFTCAVYRAVYLDLVDSLSTQAFIKSLKGFVERFGRPAIIYSDNGTNFRGADSLFRALNWDEIQQEESVQPITWKFSPPSGPWWGGWWERLIRTVKDLLRRTVGKAVLTKRELMDMLKKIEQVMNERPLTYVAETTDDLEPLTPNMFLKPRGSIKFPEGELNESDKLRVRFNFMRTLWGELKQRFQKEYLSLLVSKSRKKPTRELRVGELVIVGDDQRKRLDWPLGRILELSPGKDGIVRVARIKMNGGDFIRPVQRLYPLEVDGDAVEGHQMQTRLKAELGN